MTLRRRSVGRGRWAAAASAAVILVGCLLPWIRSGGSDGIPAISVNAFDGTGILVFLAALAVLALVSLPFAMGDVPVAIDRWWAYGAIAAVAVVGLLIRILEALGIEGGLAIMLPDRGPGTWVTLAGVIGLLVATAQMFGTRRV